MTAPTSCVEGSAARTGLHPAPVGYGVVTADVIPVAPRLAEDLRRVDADEVVDDTDGQVFCAQLWVRGTSPEMRLAVRVSPSGRGSAFSSPLDLDGGWVKVPPGAPMAVSSSRGESLSVLAKTQYAASGDTLIIDVEFEP